MDFQGFIDTLPKEVGCQNLSFPLKINRTQYNLTKTSCRISGARRSIKKGNFIMKRLSAAFLMLILILSLSLFASAAQKNIQILPKQVSPAQLKLNLEKMENSLPAKQLRESIKQRLTQNITRIPSDDELTWYTYTFIIAKKQGKTPVYAGPGEQHKIVCYLDEGYDLWLCAPIEGDIKDPNGWAIVYDKGIYDKKLQKNVDGFIQLKYIDFDKAQLIKKYW